jgi:hypothetical protein
MLMTDSGHGLYVERVQKGPPMLCFRIYAGLDSKGRLSHPQASAIVLRLAAKWFPHGHTVISAEGRWEQDNAPVNEPTLIVEVIAESGENVFCLAGDIKTFTFQESVLVTSHPVEATLL